MEKKIKLLIVDDEERFLKTLTQRLGLRDFEVTPASNGQLALETAENQKFELALVDLKMPGMRGEQVLELLKEKDPYIEVVILTGHGSIDSAVECTKLGCFGYLQKPCETEELMQVLKDAYQARVQKKLKIDEDKIQKLLNVATGESPLGILRKLRELEEKG
jgi:DNA-binding NtrC family response regulator